MIYQRPHVRRAGESEGLCNNGSIANTVGSGGRCNNGVNTSLDGCNAGTFVGGDYCTYGDSPSKSVCLNGGTATDSCAFGSSPSEASFTSCSQGTVV